MSTKNLKDDLRYFGITHKDVAQELGIAQSTVTQLLDEELVEKVKTTAQNLIDRKVSGTQAYVSQRLEDVKQKLNPVLH
jgi:predicted transcriptional regulator